MQNNYAINKYFVLDDYYDIDRSLYSDSLHSDDSGDKTQWLEYFTDGVKCSLQSALGKYKNAVVSLKITQRLTPKEQEVLNILQEREEITSNDLADTLNVSRQQAHSLLKALLEKGFIGKKGSTKASCFYDLTNIKILARLDLANFCSSYMLVMNIFEAKTNLSKLIELVLGGKEVVIAKAGKPVVKLVSYKEKKKPRVPGLWKGKVWIADDFNKESKIINKLFYGQE